MSAHVVATGCAAITPAGVDIAALWQNVVDGPARGGPIDDFDVSRNASRIAAAIPGFDPIRAGLAPADAARMDRATQLAVIASRAAVADAGLTVAAIDPRRVGVCIGTAIGGVGFMEREFRRVSAGGSGAATTKPAMVRVGTDLAAETYGAFLAHSVSADVTRDLGFNGPSTTMATGCTAGLDAIGAAASLISAGMADVVITGGVDAPLTPIVLSAFDKIKALTRRNGDPSHASRPFDRDRDGFLLAEGCAIIVLESLAHARRRGARVYGQVLGFASLSNAYHMTSLDPAGDDLAATIEVALSRARVDGGEVDYINAHGSSTKQNDRNETSAFKRVFGERARHIPISSTKSVLGHSLGAASAIETVVCLMALTESVVPPTVNYETRCPECDLDYVPNIARELPLRVVACNANGFSGIHSALVLGHRDYHAR